MLFLFSLVLLFLQARRKHQIKILISTKPNNNDELKTNSNDKHLTNKVVNIEFIADYVISNYKEWIHAIIIDNDELKTFSQETINHILEVIRTTMKKQCNNQNSKADVLPLPILNLDKNVTSQDEKGQTKTDIKNKKNLYGKKIKTPNIKEIQKYTCKRCDLKMNSKKSFGSYIK